MNNKVISFIKQFKNVKNKSEIEHMYSEKYCLYFAVILKTAFDRGTICINSTCDHIVWQDVDGICYDIFGKYTGEVQSIENRSKLINEFKHI